MLFFGSVLFIAPFCMANEKEMSRRDPRNILNGREIPDESYCDQPYIVTMKDGTWVCMLTTAPGEESSVGQHVVVTKSRDHGKTWSPLVDIEPGTGPHASWVVPLLTPYGRLYAFYTFNGDEKSFGKGRNHDSIHGWYAFRFSDDGGKSWSERHRVPIRNTFCDDIVLDGTLLQAFWGVSKPQVIDGELFTSFTKLREHYLGFGEGWIIHSDNIMTEKDPAKLHWELLPDGEYGIRHPEFGCVQEEHIAVPLNRKDGLACVYRTTQGFPAFSYSYDRAKSWTLPERMKYVTGRTIHTPRACPMLWKCANGNYLFWFHNNANENFLRRNPAWVSGGIERDGRIHWSQPEVLIYVDSPYERMSYPDLIEADGKYWVSETDKSVGRVHEIDPTLFEGLWETVGNQLDAKKTTIIDKGLVLETSQHETAFPKEASDLLVNRGMTLDLIVDGRGLKPGEILFDNRDKNKTGLSLRLAGEGQVVFTMRDKNGKEETTWTSDPGAVGDGVLPFTVIVDSAPKIISFVSNGQFNDGGGQRTFGWGRFKNVPTDISGSAMIKTSPGVKTLRIYNRYLRNNEAVRNHLAR